MRNNTKIYIIGKKGKIRPINMVGELAIAGVQLAHGYLVSSLFRSAFPFAVSGIESINTIFSGIMMEQLNTWVVMTDK